MRLRVKQDEAVIEHLGFVALREITLECLEDCCSINKSILVPVKKHMPVVAPLQDVAESTVTSGRRRMITIAALRFVPLFNSKTN